MTHRSGLGSIHEYDNSLFDPFEFVNLRQ